MQLLTLNEAAPQWPALLKAAVNGEEVVIQGDENEIVKLVPVAAPLPRKAGSAKGMVTYMADDFDAPLEDFKEYME